MKWVIKNPAPTDSRMKKWGDFHFARSLAKYLERLGQEVVMHYHSAWDEEEHCDVVLVLRGRHRYVHRLFSQNTVKVLWNISHPNDVSIDEYESYDIVCVASVDRARYLENTLSRPVIDLLQCTDHEEFARNKSRELENHFIFVGNTRNVQRDSVIWSVEFDVPLKIWGRGWSNWIDVSRCVVDDYYDNEFLGDLYSRSMVTLNDHWGDMKEFGFINNRVLDAIAAELVVISDFHEALFRIFPNEILYFSNKSEFWCCIQAILLNYPALQRRVRHAKKKVLSEFTFENRANTLLKSVLEFKKKQLCK